VRQQTEAARNFHPTLVRFSISGQKAEAIKQQWLKLDLRTLAATLMAHLKDFGLQISLGAQFKQGRRGSFGARSLARR